MSASSPSSSAPLRSPAARACRDVMQCVFAFLTLTELVRVARCCVQWDKWAAMPMGRTDAVTARSHFRGLVGSRMMQHATGIALKSNPVRIEDVNHLCRTAPKLVNMDVMIGVWDFSSNVRLQLPSTLTNLTIEMNGIFDVVENVVAVVFEAVSLRKLNLDTFTGLPQSTFANIMHLTQLESLTIREGMPISEVHLHAIKQLECLRVLSLFDENWPSTKFETLCEPPHKLQNLEEIRMRKTWLQVRHVESLQHVPTLTRLEPETIETPGLCFLHRYLQPAVLHLQVRVVFREVDDLMWLARCDLSRIQTLHLSGLDLSGDYGIRFLCTQLVSVTKLRLSSCLVSVDPTCLHMPALREFTLVESNYNNHPYQNLRPVNFTGMPALTSFRRIEID